MWIEIIISSILFHLEVNMHFILCFSELSINVLLIFPFLFHFIHRLLHCIRRISGP